MTLWNHQDESTLHCYIVHHQDRSLKIDWSDLREELPHRNLAECKTKYYRMLRKPCWDFSGYLIKGRPRAAHRGERRADPKIETDSSVNDQIELLVRTLALQ